MPRIRSIKPEAFQSESLSRVSLEAERTLFGLSTQADDRGRISDKPAQINGFIWAMRGDHSADQLDGELKELESEDIVCRYTGCDGRRYLHLVKWDDHQQINRPSASRLPRCPEHLVSASGVVEQCGRHEGACPSADPSLNAHAHLSEPSTLDLGSRNLDRGSRTVDRGESPSHAQARTTPPKPPPRGTRIPDGFAITPQMAEWGRAEFPHVDGPAETAKFIDYWRAKPGAGGRKSDWTATWRNWIRRAAEQPARASPRGRQAETDAQFERAMQRAQARENHDPQRDDHPDPLRPRLLPAAGDG